MKGKEKMRAVLQDMGKGKAALKVSQNKTRQDKTRQDNPRQDKTRQD